MLARVVGSGIAGIASSIRLAAKGYEVHVHEANSYLGGKLTAFNQEGFRFDAGPSLFTMPFLVDELFELSGKNPSDYFEYQRLDKTCHYFWEDGLVIHGHAKPTDLAQEVESKLGVKQQVILDFLEHSALLYNKTAPVFLERSLHVWKNYFTAEVWEAFKHVHQLNLTSTMNQVHQSKLKEPHLVQLFNRFATYNGSNPYKAPGVLSIIPHLEHNQGAYFPKGGMHSITQSLVKLAQDLGVTFHLNQRVQQIEVEKDRVTGIVVDDKLLSADLVFSNMDVVPTYRKLMPNQKAPERTLKQERSSSALIFYWGMEGVSPELDVHNILFSDRYQEEFKSLFEDFELFEDPTVYIHVSSKVEKQDAPEGCENWFVMINVPGKGEMNWEALIPIAKSRIIAKIERILQKEIASKIQNESVLHPGLIEQRTSSYQGALYGSSSNNAFSAFWRHPNFSQKIKGLYFCGGSVHPGGGIPLCLLSAKIATGLVSSHS